MNLVRAGHLHTPVATPSLFAEAGDCSTATVAHVNVSADDVGPIETVNLGVLDHEGLRIHGRSNVEVRAPRTADEVVDPDDLNEGATFHLSGDCPWKR